MTSGKQKTRTNNCHELDTVIAWHRYNSSIVAECTAAAIDNCIQAPFLMDAAFEWAVALEHDKFLIL